MITIESMREDDHAARKAAAQLLVDGFREHWPEAWSTLEDGLEEVEEALEPGKICRVARAPSGEVVGWIGGQPEYGGNVWELHPLVVRADMRKQSIGRALIADLEQQVAARGGLTIMLGSDDESAMTTLAGVDLYPDPWSHIAAIQNLRGHPYTFYQRCGFVIVGVVPDANGLGKPDIMMAKRVSAGEHFSS